MTGLEYLIKTKKEEGIPRKSDVESRRFKSPFDPMPPGLLSSNAHQTVFLDESISIEMPSSSILQRCIWTSAQRSIVMLPSI
jgi:hypothetical protein